MSKASENGLFRLARSNSDFARLWGGVTISDLGSSVTNLALPLVAVITLQVGAKEMEFLNASGHLPVLLFLRRCQVATLVKLLAGRQHY